MKVAAIIQARMGSSRLPGKVMLSLAGRPMIDHVVERAGRISGLDETVVATTTEAEDDQLTAHLRARSVRVSRGPAQDVLQRYRIAAEGTGADAVVRITSDCPLLSPTVSALVVAAYLAAPTDYDYVSNSLDRTYPRGLDTEIFSAEALAVADANATAQPDREHVTAYIYRHPDLFRLKNVAADVDRHEMRWTVDTAEDFELVSRIYEELYPANPTFEFEDVLALLEVHPDWVEINRQVRQKAYGQ